MANEKGSGGQGGTATVEKGSTQATTKMDFPSGGKNLTVEQFRRSMADLPGNMPIKLHYPQGWQDGQSFLSTSNSGYIAGINAENEALTIEVGNLGS
jgi:hypothetical protein